MDTERHTLAKRLFGEVCDLPENERHARLRQLTGDGDVIAYVESLLRNTSLEHPRISQPILQAMSNVAGDEIKVGDTLGAWKLTEKIGQGGMGAVFRAERADGHFEQQSAIKLLHGVPSVTALEYLARERQILATLIHPNIARLYDGGATPGGQPYLVMEFVEGLAIDQYVRAHKLAVPARLKLILAVCDAIDFAHRRLIVHCDIKPSNILVTAAGRPMLLDFGIARLLDAETGGDTAPDPVTGKAPGRLTLARAFTPQYASPEQRSGAAVTTATDVYSLGFMLKELLPDVKDDELIAISAKATRDDPAQRYASAGELAADIERYFAKRPVTAVPLTAAYAGRKFVQRDWPWLAAAGVFLFTIGVSTQRIVAERDRAQSAEQAAVKDRDATRLAEASAVRERDGAHLARTEAVRDRDRAAAAERATAGERDRAKAAEATAVAERDRARKSEEAQRQTTEFLVSIFDSGTPNAESGDMPVSKMLAAAEPRLEKQLKGQAGAQAELYSAMGRVQNLMGAQKKAIANYERAIALERTQNRPVVLAAILQRYSKVLQDDDFRAAEKAVREALALFEKYGAKNPADRAGAELALGAMLSNSGRRDEAEPYLERALTTLERIDPASADTALALHTMGVHAADSAGATKAVPYLERSLEIRRMVFGAGHPTALATQAQLGLKYADLKRHKEAEALLREVVAIDEKLRGPENRETLVAKDALARAYIVAGRLRDAIAIYEVILPLALKSDGVDSGLYQQVANNLGLAYMRMTDFAGALPLMLQVEAYTKAAYADTDDAQARSQRNLGRTLMRLGRHDEARVRINAAYEHARRNRGADSAAALEAVTIQATNEMLAGNDAAARATLVQIDAWPSKIVRTDRQEMARVRGWLAEREGKWDEALTHYKECEELVAKSSGPLSSSAWLAKRYRAAMLRKRNGPGDREAGAKLAQEIITGVGTRIADKSPLWAELRAIREP